MILGWMSWSWTRRKGRKRRKSSNSWVKRRN
jgi:hypothetical protein